MYVPLYPRGNLGSPTVVLRGISNTVSGPYTWTEQPELPTSINPASVTYVDATGATVFSLWLGGSIFTSSSPDGPWHSAGHYPGVNPAPVYHNGAFFMTNQHTSQIFTSPRLGAPWTLFSNISQADLPPENVQYRVEDPVLFIDKRGNWHIINHAYANTQFAACSTSDVSAHFFSPDGVNWAFSRQPYGHTVTFDDGTSHTYTTLERPNLRFDADGRPTHLHLAADLVTGDEGCANRTDHSHNGHTPCDNCKWDDLSGTIVVALA